MSDFILEVKDLHKKFTLQDGRELNVLNGISTGIRRNDNLQG